MTIGFGSRSSWTAGCHWTCCARPDRDKRWILILIAAVRDRTARTDASGFFALPDATGTVRFAVEIDGTVRHTEWVVI